MYGDDAIDSLVVIAPEEMVPPKDAAPLLKVKFSSW